MRMSNLYPSRSKGLAMYFCTTMLSVQLSSARLLITLMPLPRDLPMGFMIQQLRSRLLISYQWNLMLNCVNSLGRLQVRGRKLRGIFSILRKASRFLQRRSFRERFLLKGKWLILCQTSSLLMSMSGLLQDQNRFQLDRREHPCGSSFQPFLLRKPVEMMSQTYYRVLITRQQRLSWELNCPWRLALKVSSLYMIFLRLTWVFSAWWSSCRGSVICRLLPLSKGRKTAGWKKLLFSLKCCRWEVNMLMRSRMMSGMSGRAWFYGLVYMTEKMWLKVGQIQRQLKVGRACSGFWGAATNMGGRLLVFLLLWSLTSFFSSLLLFYTKSSSTCSIFYSFSTTASTISASLSYRYSLVVGQSAIILSILFLSCCLEYYSSYFSYLKRRIWFQAQRRMFIQQSSLQHFLGGRGSDCIGWGVGQGGTSMMVPKSTGVGLVRVGISMYLSSRRLCCWESSFLMMARLSSSA